VVVSQTKEFALVASTVHKHESPDEKQFVRPGDPPPSLPVPASRPHTAHDAAMHVPNGLATIASD
jgi:hypothetical protein